MERKLVDFIANAISEQIEHIKKILECEYKCQIKTEIRVSVEDPEPKKEDKNATIT